MHEMDSVERIVTQGCLQACPQHLSAAPVAGSRLRVPGLQVNTDAISVLPFAGAAADIVLDSASTHVPPCWLRCSHRVSHSSNCLAEAVRCGCILLLVSSS